MDQDKLQGPEAKPDPAPVHRVVSPMTFGSLFAGIGGFDLGFERAGLVCKWQVEIDDYATRVLEKHWPSVHRERDIRSCGRHNLERVDIICGGFPCQDISYAGRGAGIEGERSGLFFEAIRVVRELRPRIVVLENVAALLTRGMDRVLGTLAEIGFDAEWHCIPAAAVSAPHIRDRAFVLGYANCGRGPAREQAGASARHGISTCSASIDASSMAYADGKGLEGWPQAESRATRETENAEWSRMPIERSRWWVAEPSVGRVADGVPRRVDRLRGLGNAVVPQVAEWIGRNLVLNQQG